MTIKRTMFGHKLNAKAPFKGVHNIRKWINAGQAVYPITDWTKFDNQILDQGQEGDCTAASSGGTWMYLELYKWRIANPGYTEEAFQAQVAAQLTVAMDMIYALELEQDGDFGEDNGSFGATAAFVLENFGAAYSDVWPNTGMGFNTQPSAEALAAAANNKVDTFQLMDLEELRINLSEGFPAWLGCPVFGSFVNSAEVMSTGIIPMPSPGEKVAGGHEMKVIGHSDLTGQLTIANSWGTSVGVNGYFKMSYDYFHKYVTEVYTARLK